ncbi:hypothetical protein BN946_scf184652.g25 [Trametes cinnabarina]|uniref:arginyltransferase n=1 Tax=Pycnoporus cinnabarinus TaxID=5643 RepID=A0A060S8J3_PYCCI|nr:hypothetical protein BN946_scf184652.g25 [Trametes cinnabarina]
MIDRGWRRSGTYCYKPDLKRSCCPQYTIKLDALQFKPSKSQRKLLNRFNRFVSQGDSREASNDPVQSASTNFGPDAHLRTSQPSQHMGKGKGKGVHIFELTKDIHASEVAFTQCDTPMAHKFEVKSGVTLEPSSFTEEKFALYKSYQKEIHHEDDKAPSSFKRFLVQSPLIPQRIEYPSERPFHLPENYGSYHQLYRLDGELIAVGVIDILPHCVSSVYFMYEKKWDRFSLGKASDPVGYPRLELTRTVPQLSALREASLAREIHEAGVPGMQYLYMGFYIHSCPKMRYKGDYAPSYLADPEEYTWFPLERCRPLLDQYHYACFAHPEHSLKEPSSVAGNDGATILVIRVVESCYDLLADPTPTLSPEILIQSRYIADVQGNQVSVAPVPLCDEWEQEDAKDAIILTLAAMGEELAKEVLLDLMVLSESSPALVALELWFMYATVVRVLGRGSLEAATGNALPVAGAGNHTPALRDFAFSHHHLLYLFSPAQSIRYPSIIFSAVNDRRNSTFRIAESFMGVFSGLRSGLRSARGFVQKRPALKFTLSAMVWFPLAYFAIENGANVKAVRGRSMQPTLNPDDSASSDIVLFDSFSVKFLQQYNRGDIVALNPRGALRSARSPTDSKLIVKRIVALPGDTVRRLI